MVYSPQSRDFRPEKRYGGGQANELYIFDLKTNAAKRITEGPRATRDAMWIGDTIYLQLGSRRPLQSLRLQRRRAARLAGNPEQAMGRALAQLRSSRTASSTRWMANCRFSTRRTEEPRPFRSTFRMMVWRAGPAASRQRTTSSLTT